MKFYRVFPTFAAVFAAIPVLVVSKKKQTSKNIFRTPNHRFTEFPSPEWVSQGRLNNHVNDCKSVSLSQDGRTVAIGCHYVNSSQGQVLIYSLINNVWVEQKVFYGGASYGWSVSLSGDGSTVAIGAKYNSGNSGYVRVYRYTNNTWTQLGMDLNGEAPDNQSGWSVSLSEDGSTVAIGAIFNDGNGSSSGHVRVHKYSNSNNTWTQLGMDLNGEASYDRSGYSVSLSEDGSTVAIGAIYNDGNGSNSGHVRVYRYYNNAWTQLGMDLNGEGPGDVSGCSVSLSNDGSNVAIGAYGNDGNGYNSGHVRVYRYSSGIWTQVGVDLNGEASSDSSGWSISLSGDASTVAIGALRSLQDTMRLQM